MVVRGRDGMARQTGRTVPAEGAFRTREDRALVERVRRMRRKMFDADALPDEARYTAEEHDKEEDR